MSVTTEKSAPNHGKVSDSSSTDLLEVWGESFNPRVGSRLENDKEAMTLTKVKHKEYVEYRHDYKDELPRANFVMPGKLEWEDWLMCVNIALIKGATFTL
jgi:hypothetical protein